MNSAPLLGNSPGTPTDSLPCGDDAAIDFSALAEEEILLDLINPTEEDVEPSLEMVESVREHGLIYAMLVSMHPSIPGEYELLNGHHRYAALRRAGRKTGRCKIIERVVSESERQVLVVEIDGTQRQVKPSELARRMQRWLDLDERRTQAECAVKFRRSESTVCRYLADYSMPAPFKEKTLGLSDAVRQVLMTEHDPVKQQRAIDYAITIDEHGKRPSRDKVALFIKRNRKDENGGRKPGKLKGKFDGRDIVIGLKKDDCTDAVIKALKDLAAKLDKYKDAPPESLGFVLA